MLELITDRPGLDDVEIADELGEDPFVVSVLLGELEERGLIVDADDDG